MAAGTINIRPPLFICLSTCGNGMTIALIMTHSTLLGMAPCARCRMRELCKATRDALKTVIHVWRDEYMIRVYPYLRDIVQHETLRPRPHHQYVRGPPSVRLIGAGNGLGVVKYVFNDECCYAQYDRWQWGDSVWQWYGSNLNWSSSSSSSTWTRPQRWWPQYWRQHAYDDRTWWHCALSQLVALTCILVPDFAPYAIND